MLVVPVEMSSLLDQKLLPSRYREQAGQTMPGTTGLGTFSLTTTTPLNSHSYYAAAITQDPFPSLPRPGTARWTWNDFSASYHNMNTHFFLVPESSGANKEFFNSCP
ncbi:hypothetical protein ASPCAL05090 [Aspergillus calidoustus]|uniref:Uncharacterized protein n=1 Tax=Aspergillus calidoustus TaxID=454130 RepID=A0A0U5FWE6_ASPCI|nr:hypothetical protein ASPCAL05090 [Aspergillus calidoustus]